MPDFSPQNGLIVTSNELVHAKYHFSLWQKRVFMYFVAQIEKDAREFGMQKVYIADLARFFEAEQNGTVNSIIENVPRQLFETAIQVPYRDEEGNERFGEVRLVTKYTKPQDKKPGNAYIELKFNEDLKPHLLDLKKQFSKYDLQYIVHLQSAHAIRIYEILKSQQYRGQIDLDVDYLKTILEVDNKYKLYGDFKRKIIDKAQQEMTSNCDIGFTYEEIKSGKKVVTLRFRVFENSREAKTTPQKGRAAAKNAAQPENGADAEKDALFLELQQTAITEWGVSPTRLLELIKAHPAERIRQAFRVTKRKVQTGKISSKAGFFVEAIQKGFTDEEELSARKRTEQATKQASQKQQAGLLQLDLADMVDAMRGEINAVIRSLVENDPKTRERAIQTVRQTKNPVLKREIEKIGAGEGEQGFRQNPKLREAVVWEIVGQNAEHFSGIREKYTPQIGSKLEALAKLSQAGNLKFEVKRFLSIR